MHTKRFVKAVSSSTKWAGYTRIAHNLLSNLINYRKFSLNPNTAKHWNERLSELGDTWRDEHYRHILDLFPENEPFTLLDIGCALGDGCELLQSHFPLATIAGVDISRVGIENAKKRETVVEYATLDILKQPLPHTYDYITIVETLEHFDNPLSVVEKCQNHIKKSLIISVPYRQYCGKDQESLQSQSLNRSEHRYSFDHDTLSRFCAEVVRVTEYIQSTKARCIIYEIRPTDNSHH